MKKSWGLFLSFFVVLCFVPFGSLGWAKTQVTVVKVIRPESEKDLRQTYYLNLLKLALDKTKEQYGDYSIVHVEAGLQRRRTVLIARGSEGLDVIWTMTDIDREKKMLPVRIPLLKDLMGFRVSIVSEARREILRDIKTLDELKKLTALQGHDWPDTNILLANGFKVDTATNYESMFLMMSQNRADYFPRGINEPFDEVRARPDLKLVVDDNIMLQYFAPFFFFVNTRRPALRDRIEQGLNKALADGSFDRAFYNDPSNKEMISRLNFKKYRVFKLNNPFLTEETRKLEGRKEFTFHPEG